MENRYFAIMLLGLWLIAGAFTFGTHDAVLQKSDLIMGFLLMALGWISRKEERLFAIWGLVLLGLWLQVAPLVLWAQESALYLNETSVGVLTVLLVLAFRPLPGERQDFGGNVPPKVLSNPSRWPSRALIGLGAFLCWMISRYLAAYQLGFIDSVWDPFFSLGTQKVLGSDVSKAFPVSDAGLGAFAYALECISACLGGQSRWRTAPWAVLLFGLLVIPVSLVSVILVVLQPLVVGSWCFLCLLTATLMLVTIPFAVGEVAATFAFLKTAQKGFFWRLLFQGGFCREASEQKEIPFNASLKLFWASARSGLSFPRNLVSSIFIGILLMCAPAWFFLEKLAFMSDPILGALAVIVAVLGFSERLRPLHFINGFLGALAIGIAFLAEHGGSFFFHTVIGALLIALCFDRKDLAKRQRSG